MRKSVLLLASAIVAVLVASGVAWAATIQCPSDGSKCEGTSGRDEIYGNDEDLVYGDWILGRDGADKVYGRGGDDQTQEVGGGLFGGDGEDVVRGGDGFDDLFGGRDSDRLYGGRGPDNLEAEAPTPSGTDKAPDLLVGGPGDDYILAVAVTHDTTKDRVYCGTGFDYVFANDGGRDEERGTFYGPKDYMDDSCEHVKRR